MPVSLSKHKFSKKFKCPICLECMQDFETHHIVPQSLAGNILTEEQGEGPTVDLCSRCHRRVHLQAINFCSKTKVKRMYFTPFQLPRALQYIKIIVLCLRRERANPNPHQVIKSILHFTKQEVRLIQRVKALKGFKNKEKFMKKIILDFVIRELKT